MPGFRFTLVALSALLIGLPALPARADDDGHELAREALQRGEIRPLNEILATVQRQIPSEILEVEFEDDDGMWIYEIKAVDPSGRLLKIYVDATNSTILRVKKKNAHSSR